MTSVSLIYQKDTDSELENAFIKLNSNSLSEQFVFDFDDAIKRLDDNPPSGCLLLGSGARPFWQAWSLEELRSNPKQALSWCAKLEKALALLAQLPCPTIIRIDSLCQGWGLSLALSCDWRWATSKAQFGSAEAAQGLPPGFNSWMLPKVVGQTWAKRLILGQEIWQAAQAYQLGLVDRLIEQDDPEGPALMRKFGSIPRQAYLSSRRLLTESAASLRENHLGAYLAALSQALNT